MKDQDIWTKERELVKDDEINLISLVKKIWRGRRKIIKATVICSFFGLFIALFSEKEYAVSTIMVPQIENQTAKLGGLSSLASLAGINMDMNTGSNDISPTLYPMIISSVEFQLDIMNSEFRFEEMENPTSLLDYYTNIYSPGLFGTIKEYTIELPGLIKSKMQKKQLNNIYVPDSATIQLTSDQDKVRKIIDENLSLVVDEDEGYLNLISRFHQAFLSAQVAQKSQALLQEYITQFKVEKAIAQLEFIKERFEENKSEFEEAQSRLAAFRDANKNIFSEIARTNEERLQNEYQLAFEVYSELAKQLEQSLIKVEEDTPVFSVIKDVVVPTKKSKPKRSMIILIWFFLGGIAGIGWVFGSEYLKLLKQQWKES